MSNVVITTTSGAGRTRTGDLREWRYGMQYLNAGGSQSVEAKDREQAFVNPPDLLGTGVPDGISQTVHIHCSDLFDENPGRLAFHHELRSKGRRAGACRRGRHQDNRARPQRIGLNNDPESATSLLMPHAFWQSQLVHITPEHGDSPSVTPLPTSLGGLARPH